MKTEVSFSELYDLINTKTSRQLAEERLKSRDLSISTEKLIEQLGNIEKEILAKHKKTLKLWRKTWGIYQKFLKIAPGSNQMRTPAEAPETPRSLTKMQSTIKMLRTITDDTMTMTIEELKTLFQTTTQAWADAVSAHDSYVANVSGYTALYDAHAHSITS